MSKIVIVLFALAAVGAVEQIPSEGVLPICDSGCQCGTTYCQAGQACDAAINTCFSNYPPVCAVGVVATAGCLCGPNPVYCFTGETCDAATNTCHTNYPVCSDQTGTVSNSIIPCTCGRINSVICFADMPNCYDSDEGNGFCTK